MMRHKEDMSPFAALESAVLMFQIQVPDGVTLLRMFQNQVPDGDIVALETGLGGGGIKLNMVSLKLKKKI